MPNMPKIARRRHRSLSCLAPASFASLLARESGAAGSSWRAFIIAMAGGAWRKTVEAWLTSSSFIAAFGRKSAAALPAPAARAGEDAFSGTAQSTWQNNHARARLTMASCVASPAACRVRCAPAGASANKRLRARKYLKRGEIGEISARFAAGQKSSEISARLVASRGNRSRYCRWLARRRVIIIALPYRRRVARRLHHIVRDGSIKCRRNVAHRVGTFHAIAAWRREPVMMSLAPRIIKCMYVEAAA